MDFDEMMDTWRSQDAAPPFELNRDALLQALQTEEASVRRERRRDMWIVGLVGIGQAVFGACWMALSVVNRWSAIYIVAAGLGSGIVAVWSAVYLTSRWRQVKSERNFGNTLRDEVRRTLSRVDVGIARFGRWGVATLQIAPLMVGAMLINWSIGMSQSDGPDDSFGSWWIHLMVVLATIYLVRAGHRYAKQKLKPRQQRLRTLLAELDA